MNTTVTPGKQSPKSFATRFIAYPLEAVAAIGFMLFFRLLPLRTASNFGSFIVRKLGPLLSVQKTARKNLQKAFPEMDDEKTQTILNDMWDNLGRNLGEMPHLPHIFKNHENFVKIKGLEFIKTAVSTGKPVVFVTAHLGNWEIGSLPHYVTGRTVNSVYRAANNPWVEKFIYQRMRDIVPGEMIPKGAPGAKRILQLMNKGEHIGMLSDQKMNDGIAVKFFGRDAMTAPAVAQFALRYNSPVVMMRVIRKQGTQFEIRVEEPFVIEQSGNRKNDIAQAMRKINKIYERWITEHPAQWLWPHNRWPKGS